MNYALLLIDVWNKTVKCNTADGVLFDEISKSTNGLCIWVPDPLIIRFAENLLIKGSGIHKRRLFVLFISTIYQVSTQSNKGDKGYQGFSNLANFQETSFILNGIC